MSYVSYNKCDGPECQNKAATIESTALWITVRIRSWTLTDDEQKYDFCSRDCYRTFVARERIP